MKNVSHFSKSTSIQLIRPFDVDFFDILFKEFFYHHCVLLFGPSVHQAGPSVRMLLFTLAFQNISHYQHLNGIQMFQQEHLSNDSPSFPILSYSGIVYSSTHRKALQSYATNTKATSIPRSNSYESLYTPAIIL